MIVWIASYPKSGNTLVRSMLATYFFSKDGTYNFSLLKKINPFPSNFIFQSFGIDTNNIDNMIKNYITVQKLMNKNISLQFLKTHSHLFNFYNKYPFTNPSNSLGVIYVVRDPRNVVESLAKFNSISVEEACENMITKLTIGGVKNSEIDVDRTLVFTGSWGSNYNSWKSFKSIKKYLLVKYEDLILNRKIIFHKILEFVHELKNSKFIINQKKFDRLIETTDFNYMKKLEIEKGFSESKVDAKTGKKIVFFDKGSSRDWRVTLNDNIRKKIENNFEHEMKELGYL